MGGGMKIYLKSNKKKLQKIEQDNNKKYQEVNWMLTDDQFRSILQSKAVNEEKINNRLERLFSSK